MNRILTALENKSTDRVPIWFMRQAGRYLPEYRETRKKYGFKEMVMLPEVAAEITLQPIKRFDLDAAIIFADIMTILDGLQIPVHFDNGGPEIDFDLANEAHLQRLFVHDYADILHNNLQFFTQSLQMVRSALAPEKALLGFAAAPFTLVSYLVERTTSRTHNASRAFLYKNSVLMHKMLDAVSTATVTYLKLQFQAGVNAVQLFESWGDVISPAEYQKEYFPYVNRIIKEVSKIGPVIFYNKGACVHKEYLAEAYQHQCAALSIDWRMPIDYFGERPVQGNLDPALLESTPTAVAQKVSEILETRGHKPGFIFNLGHGISPEAKLENVEAMVQTVKDFKP